MKPCQNSPWMVVALLGIVIFAWCASGCNSPLMHSQSPESKDFDLVPEEEPEEEFDTALVGDRALPWGLNHLMVQGVALVNGLDGTGCDPAPSPLRTSLVGEMQTHEVRNPEQLLESSSNTLAVVKGYLPPGVRKGDRIDVEVALPAKSKATSLQGGYLMRCRLREMRLLDNAIRSGHVSALAQGSVIVDSIFQGTDDEQMLRRGRVLGGGRSQIDRPLSLVVRSENSSVRQSAMIGAAINARFARQNHGSKTGVATPKRDNFIELVVHSRYKNNISRYVRVVRSIALRESGPERLARLEVLQRRLLEPTTSARAALQLEAIGDEAGRVLIEGLSSHDQEVRFYAAEALAYLDREEATGILAEAAREEWAFRWHALTALTAMDHVAAYEALTELLHVSSAETRYGAFRALRTRNPQDPLVVGESLERDFAYHVIHSDAPPMIHFSRSRRPEIVLFGHHQILQPPAVLFAGKEIMIKGLPDGTLRVSRFGVGDEEDLHEICEADLDQMIRTIAQLGGGYSAIIQAVHEAKQGGYLQSKVVVDALARPGRTYHRDADDPDGGEPERSVPLANPIPELFSNPFADPKEKRRFETEEIAPEPDFVEKEASHGSFLGRMTDWFSR
jgi:hypothetical protein